MAHNVSILTRGFATVRLRQRQAWVGPQV